MPDDATEGVAEHSSRLQPTINLHAPVTAFMFSCSGTRDLHGPGGPRAGAEQAGPERAGLTNRQNGTGRAGVGFTDRYGANLVNLKTIFR